MDNFRFRRFAVYLTAKKLNVELKVTSKRLFPPDERFGLLSQLWRALDSVVLSIAEGSSRATDKEFAKFLNTSHASLQEVVACLDIALDLTYLTHESHDVLLKKSSDLSDQLTAFRKRLIENPTK